MDKPIFFQSEFFFFFVLRVFFSSHDVLIEFKIFPPSSPPTLLMMGKWFWFFCFRFLVTCCVFFFFPTSSVLTKNYSTSFVCVCVWCCCWLYTNAAGLWYSSLKYWTPPLACCRLVRLLCSLLAEGKKKTLLPSHNFLRLCAHFVFWIHSRPNRSPRLITSNYSQEMRRRISYSQFFGFFSIGGGISFQCLYASKKKNIYIFMLR